MSARPFHNSRSYGCLPSRTVRTVLGGHFSARNFRASSRSCFCSSEKSKFMALLCCVRHILVRRPRERAGTHNHRRLCFNSGISSSVTLIVLGVWVPAFAGTTLMGGEGSSSQHNHIL